MKSIGLKIINIQISETGILEDTLINCLAGLQMKMVELNIRVEQILKITIFFQPGLTQEFIQQRTKIQEKYKTFFHGEYPCFSLITDFPETDHAISLEVFVFTNTFDYILERKSFNDIRYSVLTGNGKKEIFVAGITLKDYEEKEVEISDHIEYVFSISRQILIREGLDFNNIVRNWNYLENITGTYQKGLKTFQNYQVFNDIRSGYFNLCNFENGYPASTGIGMAKGGIVAEFIAVSPKKDLHIKPLKNSLQTDAFSYTSDVLIGHPLPKMSRVSTPKFERAKLIKEDTDRVLFISGTASIIKEKTNAPESVIEQTNLIIELISSLRKIETIEIFNELYSKEFYFKVYVKKREHLPIVKAICVNKWGNENCQFLIADICRTDLLVEIECVTISFLSDKNESVTEISENGVNNEILH